MFFNGKTDPFLLRERRNRLGTYVGKSKKERNKHLPSKRRSGNEEA